MSVSKSEIERLLELYNEHENNPTGDSLLLEYGKELNKSKIKDFLHQSILLNLSPEKVLVAIFECLSDNQQTLLHYVIKEGVSELVHMNFANFDIAQSYQQKLISQVLKCAGNLTIYRLLEHSFKVVARKKNKDDFRQKQINELILSMIPKLYHQICNNEEKICIKNNGNPEEVQCNVQCKRWLKQNYKRAVPPHMIPSFIEAFLELELTEKQLGKFISNILNKSHINKLPSITEKIFPTLKKYPKLSFEFLRRILYEILYYEISDFEGSDDNRTHIEISLIKILFNICNTSRTVLDNLIKILTSPIELPTHFTPFLVSLTFDISRLNPKIIETFYKLFVERIKSDSKIKRSRFLNHMYIKNHEILGLKNLEYAMSYAIRLCKGHLETNGHNFSEFAFNIIDNAKLPQISKKETSILYIESSSDLIPDSLREINIAVEILKDSLQSFVSSSSEIFGQIVQRLISNSPNSIYLIPCLDSPEGLLEVINYIHYLEYPVVEQLMRYAVPKIYQNEDYLDRTIIIARKSYFSRTEKAKINGVAALFYLILPHSLSTSTQIFDYNSQNSDNFITATNNEDIQFDIFSLMKRGLTQSDSVQETIFFFIPFMLERNPELNIAVSDAFLEKYDSILKQENEIFPIEIAASVPHFLYCLSRCINTLPKPILDQEGWMTITMKLCKLSEDISNIEFEYLLEQMEIFQHPDHREIVIAIIYVLFNHIFKIDKDIALSLFRLYDRILCKKTEIDKMRKGDLKSKLKFPHFMELKTLKELFKLLEKEDGDYSDNYGIQLYALETATSMINELPTLKLELRSSRFKRVVTLGQILFRGYYHIKWSNPPAGYKTNESLKDIAANSLKNLFVFLFYTYSDKNIMQFLQKISIINPKESISDVNSFLINSFKSALSSDSMKQINNLCDIAELVSFKSPYDANAYKQVKKEVLTLINSKPNIAGKFFRIVRYYCPKQDLSWIDDFFLSIIERIRDNNEENVTSLSFLEVIHIINIYLDDISWAIKIWIPQLYSFFCIQELHKSNDNDNDNDDNDNNSEEEQKQKQKQENPILPKFSSIFSILLLKILTFMREILSVQFNRLPPNYYEAFIKLVIEFYNELTKLAKETLLIPKSKNDTFIELIQKITTEFDKEIIDFTIASRPKEKNSRGVTRQDKFEASSIPKLIYAIDMFRTSIKILSEKKIIDEDIPGEFCIINSAEVVIDSQKKKKKINKDESTSSPVPEDKQGYSSESEDEKEDLSEKEEEGLFDLSMKQYNSD